MRWGNYSCEVLWGSTKERAAVCAWEGQTGFPEKVAVNPNPNSSHVWSLSGVGFYSHLAWPTFPVFLTVIFRIYMHTVPSFVSHLFWVSMQLHTQEERMKLICHDGSVLYKFSCGKTAAGDEAREFTLCRWNRMLSEKIRAARSQHWHFLQGQFCVHLETYSLQTCENCREQWLGSEIASLGLKNSHFGVNLYVQRECCPNPV